MAVETCRREPAGVSYRMPVSAATVSTLTRNFALAAYLP
jgi:hypothetical protein